MKANLNTITMALIGNESTYTGVYVYKKKMKK